MPRLPDTDGDLPAAPADEEAFDRIAVGLAARGVGLLVMADGEPILAEVGPGLHEACSAPVAGEDFARLVRYVYGDHGPGLLAAGHVLNPRHEIVLPGDRRARVEVAFRPHAARACA